ncbi:MAG TPA: DUF5939 domain-containing protein [Herpetosiphonaceae bacterium]
MAPKPVTLRRQAAIDLPIDELWPLISDTSQTNFAIGLPQLEFSPRPGESGVADLLGEARYFGVTMRWIERPFEWISPHSFQVERRFLRNPFIVSLLSGSRLRALSPGQTQVETFATIQPRNLPGALLARRQVTQMVEGQMAFIQRAAAAMAGRSNYVPPVRRPKLNEAALSQTLDRLGASPVSPAVVEALAGVIRAGRDEEVVQMRPFVLADRLGIDRLELLRAFLYATEAGLFDMNWDVLCPNCRVSRETASSLRNLRQGSHCDTCNISYDVNFDEYVELRFSIHPTVRVAAAGTFCIGGPANSRHIVGQQLLDAGEERSFAVSLEPGSYRLRALGSEIRCALRVDSASGDAEAELLLDGDGVRPGFLHLAPGELALRCRNQAGGERLLILERDAWGTQQVSAAFVTTLPEFRTLFSSEVLAPDLGLAIKNITLFFSDLKDSTPMYERIGDSSAFALVRDHFTILFEAIQRHDGSVSMTIGDAVMAVFSAPAKAVAAALEIQRRIAAANADRGDRQPLTLKVGLHTGPCIAVNANDVLDYFGTTVNAAARAQAVSVGDDIVLTEDVMGAAGVQAVLDAAPPHSVERFTRDLKGLSGEYTLYRITPAAASE